MPEKNYLFKSIIMGGVVVGSSGVLLKFLVFGASLILLREISVYDYGLWRLLLSIIAVASLITLPGFDSAISADLASLLGQKRRSEYIATLRDFSIFIILLGVAVSVTVFFSAPLVTVVTGINVTTLLQILSIFAFVQVLNRLYGIVFSTQLRFLYGQALTVTSAGVYVMILFLLMSQKSLSLETLVFAYVASSIASLLAFSPVIFYLLKPFCGLPHATNSLVGTLKSHGKWAVLGGYADGAIGSLKPWFIGLFIGVEGVGIFSAATSLFSAASSLLPVNTILASILPRESADKKKMSFLVHKAFKYSIWAHALVALGIWGIGTILLPHIFPQYVGMVPILALLVFSLPATTLSGLSSNVLNSFKAQKEIFTASMMARLLSFAIVLPMATFFFDAIGAAIDHIITASLIAIKRYRAASRYLSRSHLDDTVQIFTIDSYDRSLFARSKNFLISKMRLYFHV